MSIKKDLKERFMNFETAKGIYLLPVGLIGMYVTKYHFQYVLQMLGFAYFGYYAFEGLRKIAVNRFKQARVRKELADAAE